jgi:hypothetical protein
VIKTGKSRVNEKKAGLRARELSDLHHLPVPVRKFACSAQWCVGVDLSPTVAGAAPALSSLKDVTFYVTLTGFPFHCDSRMMSQHLSSGGRHIMSRACLGQLE